MKEKAKNWMRFVVYGAILRLYNFYEERSFDRVRRNGAFSYSLDLIL